MEALILSCSTGGGHNSAGYAIRDELESRGHSVKMFDPYQLIAGKRVDKRVGNAYVKLVRRSPFTFGCLYKLGEIYDKTSLKSPVYLANELMEKPLQNYLQKHHFDVIFMPHLFPGQMMTNLREKGIKIPKTIFIATDYTCIPFTEEIKADYYIIPSEKLTSEFASKGIDESKIRPLGIPVRKSFTELRDKEMKTSGKHYLLLSSGSIGLSKMFKATELLSSYIKERKNYYLIVICGDNKKLYRGLVQKFGDNRQIKLVQKTDHMAEYIKGADAFISKPGGLSSTESAVLGVPLIHILPIPGCESHNISFFSNLGMSIGIGDDIKKLPEALEMLSDEEFRKRMIIAQGEEINPFASKDICDLAEEIIKE